MIFLPDKFEIGCILVIAVHSSTEIYLGINFVAISAVVFDVTSAVESTECLSRATKINATLFTTSGKDSSKSNFTYSLGATTNSISKGEVFPNAGFIFLFCSVQCQHSRATCTMFPCIFWNQTCSHRSNIAVAPRCVKCTLSRLVCCSYEGITIRSSIRRQQYLTWRQFSVPIVSASTLQHLPVCSYRSSQTVSCSDLSV